MNIKQIGLLSTALITAFGASAQVKTLYIGMNGGTTEQAYVKHVFPEFEKKFNAKVVVVPGTSSDILAKVQASKEKPPVHVMHLDDGVMMRAVRMGLCQKLADTPVLKDLYATAIMAGGMAAGVSVTTTGIGYNKKMFDEKKWPAPTSWMDFADAKYKGKVVFQSAPSSSYGLHGFLMINRALGAVASGFYIDVGGYQPISDSNTCALYQRGWRGLRRLLRLLDCARGLCGGLGHRIAQRDPVGIAAQVHASAGLRETRPQRRVESIVRHTAAELRQADQRVLRSQRVAVEFFLAVADVGRQHPIGERGQAGPWPRSDTIEHHVEIQHPFEQSGPQVGAVEQHRQCAQRQTRI